MLQEKMNNFGKRRSEKKIAKSQVPYPISAQVKAVSTMLLLSTAQLITSHTALAQTSAQTAAQMVLPESLPKDSKLTIDGSGSLAAVNQALKEKFSAKYTNTPVTFSNNGSAAGLKALLDEKIDLAAIGRRLTDAEKAQGLVEILIKREKIAMLVGDANAFSGSLTIQQFAKIFRGDVTNWSEVGGTPGPIRLVDQPESSDTRNAFPNYPVFKEAPFKAVASATQSGDENPETIASKLGEDGIGYITADGVKNIKGAHAVLMHKTMPDDPRYPFSQPIAYVYKKGKLSAATLAFLTYVSGDDAKAAIKSVSSPGAEILDTKEAVAGAIAQSTGTISAATASPVAAVPNAIPAATPAIVPPAIVPPATQSKGADFPWWLLLPIGLLGLWGLKALLGGKKDADIAGAGLPPVGATVIPPVATTDVSVPAVIPPVINTPVVEPIAHFAGAAIPDEAIAAAGMAAATIGVAGLGLAAALPLIESAPRGGITTPADPWDEEISIATPHDVMVHGEGTAEVTPRHVEGAAGGLEFPIMAGLAATGIATGIAATGIAATGIADRISPPHVPITQLPPDEYEPLEPDYAINPAFSPDYNFQHDAIEDEVPNMIPDNSPTSSSTSAALGSAVGLAGLAAVGFAGVAATTRPALNLDGVDDGLPDLPDGYGESRIVLMARDPQWGYTYWDAPIEHHQDLRNQGGQQFALRLYDVTDLDLTTQKPHSLQQYACDDMARDWYLPIPVSDRDYMAEIGYVTEAGGWLVLARSNSIRIPPVYPSDWHDDQFTAIEWEEDLADRTFLQLVPPGRAKEAEMQRLAGPGMISMTQLPVFGLSQTTESIRIAGSLYGSMQQSPIDSMSSFVFPSGMGLWTLPTPSGMGMSGISNSSGVGMPKVRSRKFWLVADAELIVYGATEPDAQVTIGGVPIQLSPDGTFRFQMSFQDGMLDFPIMAIAQDGEQMRQVRLTFNRSTPLRNTNTKEDAQDEQF